ncbi:MULTISPECIES: DUF1217 domain-containing protein [unclassified Bradyrhizobium]|uniref:DUF1217 domain-containing protein n=1 Tax=unclassified Bradyrhizobium TaxID=2631580 RepID=UPI0020B23A3C|nr:MULTISPECIES: DUF1217 domain-containing protein [unclassified Bradyrhizobium]MCP3385475.1 DUF1217 domain-containing protein [Bradyrhizobium sp. CCGUVB4N]MCP3446740.1 DUF1217 domain-containing protein [Bradyrhizobium sp. CCGUVB14]WFU83038.1 DUF1217 domain-containing protein [Bradyrhizobium sp. CIAT3101]
MLSTIADYTRLTTDMSKSLTQVEQQPDVSRDTAYYLANIGNVKSIDDFLNNYKLYSYAMKAFGLDDMIYAKAFMRKVLTEGVATSDTFANKLSDSRYRDFATAFNFAALGANATQATAATTNVTSQYATQTLEEDAGDQNEGLRLALYFTRKASSITSPYQILADKALTQVVQTAEGWSSTISSSDIDMQAKMITDKIDLTDFQDPTKVTKFVQRFAAMWDATQAQSDTSTNPALVLITGASTTSAGLDTDMLTTLQNIRFNR